ncbi:hypothetical protein EDD15DRAFT_2204121 [Pisolithus albus]|nr:hypothetical protein EDD15DRAFT_2204121 [Pisolithus albus]
MSTDAEYEQPSRVDFGVVEESLGDLQTGLTYVERRQIDNEEKIQRVDSKVSVLSARVDEFEKSHNAADEMQCQVHEMREDLDRLKGRVDKLKQSVKHQMVGATSLKDMQDSLDELDGAVTTFRQEIGLKMSRKSVLLQEYVRWGEKNVSDIAAWKATYEERVRLLEQEFSRVKGNQARLSDFYETACNDIIKLHETVDELQRCAPNHGHLCEGLKEMKLLFSSLQDKIEELGAEVAWAQTVAPSLQDDLCAVVGHGTAETMEISNPILHSLLRFAVRSLGNRLSASTSVMERQGLGLLTLLSKITDRIPMAMRRKILLWLLAAGICVFAGLCMQMKILTRILTTATSRVQAISEFWAAGCVKSSIYTSFWFGLSNRGGIRIEANSLRVALGSTATLPKQSVPAIRWGVVYGAHAPVMLFDESGAANGPTPRMSTLKVLNSKDRIYVLKLGEQMECMINNHRHNSSRLDVGHFLPDSWYHCEAYYKLAPVADPINDAISITLTMESRTRTRHIAELVPAPSDAQPAFNIMQRTATDSVSSSATESKSPGLGPAPGASVAHTSNRDYASSSRRVVEFSDPMWRDHSGCNRRTARSPSPISSRLSTHYTGTNNFADICFMQGAHKISPRRRHKFRESTGSYCWFESQGDSPIDRPPATVEDVQKDDIFFYWIRGIDMCQMWIWCDSEDRREWVAMQEGSQIKQDGLVRYLIVTDRRQPSLVLPTTWEKHKRRPICWTTTCGGN